MARPPLTLPDFNLIGSIAFPFDPTHPAGFAGVIDHDVPMAVVPTSRLHTHVPTGFLGQLQGGFIPPATNYWVDMPKDYGVDLAAGFFPQLLAVGLPFQGAGVQWTFDVTQCAMIRINGDIDYFMYLVIWFERRWRGTPVEWVRAYCIGYNWDVVTPLT